VVDVNEVIREMVSLMAASWTARDFHPYRTCAGVPKVIADRVAIAAGLHEPDAHGIDAINEVNAAGTSRSSRNGIPMARC